MASKIGAMMLRKFSTSQAMRSAASSDETVRLWKNLTLYGAFPAMAIVGAYVYLEMQAEHDHYKRPEHIPYEYMYVRTRRFFWGDGNHTLFHNPKVNALPEGYEEDE